MSDRLVIDFYNTEDDDWIRSPQVTKRHRSDAELFGKKMIRVIKKEGMNKAEFVESEHPRGQPKNAGEFSEKPGGGGEDVTEPKRQIAEQKEPNKPLSMADRNRIEMPALEDRGKRKVARVENSVYSDASQELLTAVLDELTLHISRAQEYNEKSSIYNAKSKILDIWSAASLTREGYYKFADAIIEQTSGLEQSPVYKQAVEWSVDAADKKYLKSIDFL